VDADYDPEFLRHIYPRLEWPALREAAQVMGEHFSESHIFTAYLTAFNHGTDPRKDPCPHAIFILAACCCTGTELGSCSSAASEQLPYDFGCVDMRVELVCATCRGAKSA